MDERESVNNMLVDKFGVDESTIETQSIGSTISGEMRKNAVMAVIVACIFMLFYIWFRFKDIRFASSAIIALLHDVLVVLTAYALIRISVGNTFIACMLTIVGYSINSSIIIFDRIRENLKEMNSTKHGYADIVNTSISQTFTRNIYTNLTTFMTIFMLFILGVASLKEFTLTLMVGVVAGTYSSICITGPLWLWLRTKISSKEENEPKKVAKA